MDTSRNALGTLLAAVAADPRDHRARMQAAGLALDLCLDLGDPHLADVAESLVADAPERAPVEVTAGLAALEARARAARRAVCLARRHGKRSPRALAGDLARDPRALADEVRGLAARNQAGLARAVLEVGLARFPDHPNLDGLLDLLSRSRA